MAKQNLKSKQIVSEPALKYLPPRKRLQSIYPEQSLIGITGHRYLLTIDFDCILHNDKIACKGNLIAIVKSKLLTLKQEIPNVMLVSCLAQGADMLVAYVACQLNIPLIVIVPFKDGYTNRFSQAEQNLFDGLYLFAGDKIYHLPNANQTNDNLYKNAVFF